MSYVHNLEERAWYRFLKVIYLGVYFLALCYLVAVAYFDDKPRTYLDPAKSFIACSSGSKYSAGENLIFPEPVKPLDSWEDKKAQELCNPSGTGRLASSYSVELGYSTSGSWKEFTKALLYGLGGIFLFMEVVKRAFLYVVSGKPFFSKNITN